MTAGVHRNPTPVLRDFLIDGWRVRLDLSQQILNVDIPSGPQHDATQHLDATPRFRGQGPVSAAALLFKAKQFDDGLYAAVELAAQQGAGRFPGKARLLRSLVEALSTEPRAATLIHAACRLGNVALDLPPADPTALETLQRDFLADELRSKPVGFYTWTAPLAAIFRQDRLLQTTLRATTATTLHQALHRIPDAPDVYRACLQLAFRLTNPPKELDVTTNEEGCAFFPASRSHEQVLLERLYGDRPIPEGFDLMTELIQRIRVGRISLAPTGQSGWVDHQTWALEPLLRMERMPESSHLTIGNRYKQHLEDLFRGTLALTRETHAKQGGIGGGGYGGGPVRVIWMRPELTVEPLPTVYERKAQCYRFVRGVLDEVFGPGSLSE